jgi:O-antigen/teichoic acid export membrane protein
MSSPARVLRNTLFLIASNLTTKLLGALFVILLARYLEDFGFGQYSFAFSFIAVFIIFADFGFDALTTRNVARNPDLAGEYLELVGGLRIGLSLVMISIALVAGYMLGLSEYLLLVILAAGLIYLFDKVSGLFYALFRAKERMEVEAGIQIVWKLVQTGIGLAAMYLGYALLEIVLFLLVASVFRCIISFTALRAMGVRPSRGATKAGQIVKRSAPFAAYEVGNAVYMNIVIIMLFTLQAPEETGWFTAALRILMFLLLIPTAFETAIYPLFSKLYERSGQEMRFAYGKSMKFTLIAALPVSVLIIIMSEQLAALFGEGFGSVSECLRVMAFVLPLFTLNMLMKAALWSSDSQKRMAKNIWLAAIVLAVCSFVLVSEESHVGAALALVIGEAVLLGANLLAMGRKRFPVARHLARPLLAGLGMGAVAILQMQFLADKLSAYHIAVFSLLVYVLLLLALSAFNKVDRQLVMSAIRSRKPR